MSKEPLETPSKGTFQCSICQPSRTFRTQRSLQTHQGMMHKQGGEEGGEVTSAAEVPQEFDVLVGILVKFGVKKARSEGISNLMAHAGWDAYEELKYYLSCAGSNPDRIRLILQAWSNHRGSAIPPQVLQNLTRDTKPGAATHGQGFMTKEDLEHFLEKREKEKVEGERFDRLEKQQTEILKKLENPSAGGKGEIEGLRQEIKDVKESEIKARLDHLEKGAGTQNEIVQGIKTVENLLTKYMDRGKKPILNFLVPEELPLKDVEPGAAEGIFKHIKPEYIAEA